MGETSFRNDDGHVLESSDNPSPQGASRPEERLPELLGLFGARDSFVPLAHLRTEKAVVGGLISGRMPRFGIPRHIQKRSCWHRSASLSTHPERARSSPPVSSPASPPRLPPTQPHLTSHTDFEIALGTRGSACPIRCVRARLAFGINARHDLLAKRDDEALCTNQN